MKLNLIITFLFTVLIERCLCYPFAFDENFNVTTLQTDENGDVSSTQVLNINPIIDTLLDLAKTIFGDTIRNVPVPDIKFKYDFGFFGYDFTLLDLKIRKGNLKNLNTLTRFGDSYLNVDFDIQNIFISTNLSATNLQFNGNVDLQLLFFNTKSFLTSSFTKTSIDLEGRSFRNSTGTYLKIFDKVKLSGISLAFTGNGSMLDTFYNMIIDLFLVMYSSQVETFASEQFSNYLQGLIPAFKID